MDPSTHVVSPRYVWYVIGLLTVVNAFNYMDRVALSVLAPYVKADLSLSDAQLGLLIGFAFSLFYAICGIPVARWADRGNRSTIIAITLSIWSVMTAMCAAAQSFWHLFAARIGVGIGEAGCMPTGQSLVCDYVPQERRAGAYAVLNFGVSAGMMLGIMLAGWLGQHIGWRWTFVAMGLPGLVLALIVRWTLREPVRGALDTLRSDSGHSSFGVALRWLYGHETYRLVVLFLLMNGFVNFGLTQWLPSFYIRTFQLELGTVGIYFGTALGLGQGIGLLLGGAIANKTTQKDPRLPLWIGAVATAFALPTAFGALFAPAAGLSMLLVASTGVLWCVPQGTVIATLYGTVPSNMRATGGAISIFLTSILGLGLGPFCVGVLSDFLSPSFGDQALRYALVLPASLIAAMAATLCVLAKTYPCST